MRTDELDFVLPPELIAQAPAIERGESRLLHYQSADRTLAHRRFSDLPSLLRSGDLLVFNDTRVIPARFMLRKNTGGKVEALYLGTGASGEWHVMLKNLGTAASVFSEEGTPKIPPLDLIGAEGLTARVISKDADGTFRMRIDSEVPALELLARVGRMPLPPYIKRDKEWDARDVDDMERYQTVYAAQAGSVAAPTAGLHFTEAILRELDTMKVQRAHVTLHVGLGTFKPVSVDALADHEMHAEEYSIDVRAADLLNRAKREGRRIIAVGTTAARVLESQPADQMFQTTLGQTRIFIYPPYTWRHVGALITNFHLPRSTLIALVAARVGLDEQRRIYCEAIAQKYRFFSYGDASFLE